MGGALICVERGRKEEERLERIKTFLMQNEILKSGPTLHCEGHANSFTRQPGRNAGRRRFGYARPVRRRIMYTSGGELILDHFASADVENMGLG